MFVRPTRPRQLLALLALFAALVAFVGATTPTAAQEVKPEAAGPARTPYQARFLQDYQPPERAEPLSATPCVGGFAGVYPCNNVDLLAFMPQSSIGGGSGNDVWGWTDPVTGVEYAIMGRTSGTSFVDISDPENPIYVGNLPPHTSNSTWRDIKVYADHAFVVSEASNHGMQVFDLSQLRDVVSPPVQFAETAHYAGFGSAHNVVINEDSGFAYGVGANACSGGLAMVNIQNPTSPTNAGCFSADGYTHDAQCVNYIGPDPDHQGKEVCFNANEDTLTIVDVTNKAAPAQLSRTGYTGSAYTHQGWLTEDHHFFLIDDELDETAFGHNTRTRVFDVTDLDQPVLVGFQDLSTPAIDHNLYTHEGYVFEANYRSGLRILDGTDVANAVLPEIGFFDVYPANDNPSFNGAWSVYPYFESGVVVVSGIEQGLFILQPGLAPDFGLNLSDGQFDICGDGNDQAALALTARFGYTGNVTLSANGLPGGATAGFSQNPAPVPSTVDATVTTNGTAAGSYPFQFSATDGSITHDVDATLNVFAGPPGGVTLVSPANGSSGIALAPLFTWNPAPGGATYTLVVATDPGFANVVYTATVNGTSHQPTAPLDTLTTYYWAVRPANTCGQGSFSPVWSFTTLDTPPILLVDDDDNSPDVRASYTTVLDTLGLPYDIWDTANSDNEPPAAALAQYEMIIWFTGDEFGGFAGPGAAGETALSAYLDGGGCLMMSSQDYLYDRGLTTFLDTYLGVATFNNDVTQTSVTGQGTLYGDLGTMPLSYPFTNYSDLVSPDPDASLAFVGNAGNAGVVKESTYKTTFWGFPFEALPTASRGPALEATATWCGVGDPAVVLQINMVFIMNNGSNGSRQLTFYDDGTFADNAGNGGVYVYQPDTSLAYYYNDGSNCGALSYGTYRGADRYRGIRVCTDGSGARGPWFGAVLPLDAD